MSGTIQWRSPGVSWSWILGTAIIGSLFLYSILVDMQSLLVNSGISLAILQVLFVLNILRERYIAGVGVALFLHTVGSMENETGYSIYAQLSNWDVLTHAVTAFILTVIVWSWVKSQTRDSTVNVIRLSDRYLFLWVLTLGISMSVVWELIEYGIQTQFGVPILVVGSVEDHMTDVFSGVLGSIVAAGWIVETRTEPDPICPVPTQQPQLPEGDVQYIESEVED